MNFTYFILVSMIIVWLPLIICQFLVEIVCFCQFIKWIFSKLYPAVDKTCKKLKSIINSDRYLKFASISSYLLVFLIILYKILK